MDTPNQVPGSIPPTSPTTPGTQPVAPNAAQTTPFKVVTNPAPTTSNETKITSGLSTKIIIAIIVLVAFGGGAFYAYQKSNPQNNNVTENITEEVESMSATVEKDVAAEDSINTEKTDDVDNVDTESTGEDSTSLPPEDEPVSATETTTAETTTETTPSTTEPQKIPRPKN